MIWILLGLLVASVALNVVFLRRWWGLALILQNIEEEIAADTAAIERPEGLFRGTAGHRLDYLDPDS